MSEKVEEGVRAQKGRGGEEGLPLLLYFGGIKVGKGKRSLRALEEMFGDEESNIEVLRLGLYTLSR